MKFAAALIFGLALAPAAQAASAPPTTLLMGTVAGSEVSKQYFTCKTNDGQALFQRGAVTAANPHPVALISLPLVSVVQKYSSFFADYIGVLRLSFTSATAGTLSPDYDIGANQPQLPSGETVQFEKYSAVWTPSASSLKVSFDIIFANVCILPVTALFRATP